MDIVSLLSGHELYPNRQSRYFLAYKFGCQQGMGNGEKNYFTLLF
jgi:hypothetical protein